MLVLCLLLMLLINYKGAAGLNKIRQTLTAGRPSVPALPIGIPAAGMTAFCDAVGYVKIVWPALVFGVLISAALRTSLSRTPLRRVFSGSSVRDQLAGTLAGAPLNSEQKLLTLALDEFLRRFLLHLLPKGFVRIRNFGFLAN